MNAALVRTLLLLHYMGALLAMHQVTYLSSRQTPSPANCKNRTLTTEIQFNTQVPQCANYCRVNDDGSTYEIVCSESGEPDLLNKKWIEQTFYYDSPCQPSTAVGTQVFTKPFRGCDRQRDGSYITWGCTDVVTIFKCQDQWCQNCSPSTKYSPDDCVNLSTFRCVD